MTSDSKSMASVAEQSIINSTLFHPVDIITDLEALPNRVYTCLELITSPLKRFMQSRNLRDRLSRACPWMEEGQLKEIEIIFFKVKSKEPFQKEVKLKKDQVIEGNKRTSFSYMIRQEDLIVFTKIQAGHGNSKSVKQAISISLAGEVNLLSHIKLKKEKRNEKYQSLIEHEYVIRRDLNSERVLEPGTLYVYPSKNSCQKITWLTPYYNRDGASVLKIENPLTLDGIKETTVLPENTLKLCLEMAKAIQVIHQKNLLHRDVKLENFLVDFNCETKKIQKVVIADEAFSLNEEITREIYIEVVNNGKKDFHSRTGLTVEQALEFNPFFKSLYQNSCFPATADYTSKCANPNQKDRNYQELLLFLTNLDRKLIVGTPRHIAPEVYSTRSYTKKVDIYALGLSMIRLKEMMERYNSFSEEVGDQYDQLAEQLIEDDPLKRPDIEQVVKSLETIIQIKE